MTKSGPHTIFQAAAAAVCLAMACGGGSRAWAQEEDFLVKVNGEPIKKSEVIERAFNLHGAAVLNQMIDTLVIRQAIKEHKIKADKKKVKTRLAQFKKQFKDEATFQDSLKAAGTNPAQLTKQIEDRVLKDALIIKEKNITVTKKEVKEYFEANKEKLGTPESVHVRHIMAGTEEQARNVTAALKAGADFAELAKQLSIDTASRERGGDLGFITRGILRPDIEAVAFALKSGKYSDIVKTDTGFHVLKLDEKKEAKPAKFNRIKKELKNSLLAQKISQALPAYIKELRDKAKIETSPEVSLAPARQ